MSGKNLIFGLCLVLIGFLLLARSTGIFFFSFGDLVSMIFPVGLVALGAWMIVRKKRRTEHSAAFSFNVGDTPSATASASAESARAPDPESFAETQSSTDSSDIHIGVKPTESYSPGGDGLHKYSKFIGDLNIDLDGSDLATIEASNFIGDIEIRLHGGRLRAGLNRLIVSSFIGDIRILVPKDFDYFASCSNFGGEVDVLGKQSSGFGNSLDGQTPTYDKADRKLYISANNFLGDIRIITI
jgi:lia operon protein LiaF